MNNKVAKLLFIIGILTIVCGGAVGLVLMVRDFTGVMFFISAVVSGVFVLGFSEIIKLLDEINKKLNK
ncbi:hypothetical protein BKP37_10800 [Anaerobacillus alkalilacustris]|uniref:Uncharacterized protein n=1 Tax=Anaerobacillus alkalilacustris TaxID=393763 RepID=A0A1S2LLW5_9BACI|nr:hypothetical protein [Anaerobacillus alkalilacustris]OIJ13451.1 hypothetical protein BKP37_10800 [Anaerobacillus alkalilacustris]